MKLAAITYKPSALVTFTKAEVEFMLTCSQTHYDFECRQASSELIPHDRNRKGFLIGIRNCIESTSEEYEHRLTFRQIDTLAKIIEMPPHGAKEPAGLGSALHSALRTLNANAIEDKQINQ